MRAAPLVTIAVLLAAWCVPARAGAPPFTPGDLLTGTIDVPGDQDLALFVGAVADKIKLVVTLDPLVRVRVAVLDPQGAEVNGFNLKGGKKGKSHKKKIKLTASGNHTLAVIGLGSATGAYEIKTARAPSSIGKPKVHFGVSAIPSLTYAEIILSGYPGTLFSTNVVPQQIATVAGLDLSFFGPTGATINTNAFESKSAVAAHLTNFTLTQLGQHRLRIGGLTDPTATVDAYLMLGHPVGNQTVPID